MRDIFFSVQDTFPPGISLQDFSFSQISPQDICFWNHPYPPPPPLQRIIKVGNITNDLLKTQLDSLHQNLANRKCPCLEEAVIWTNTMYAKHTVRILSFSPQSCFPFSGSLQAFCSTALPYLNKQKYGLFWGESNNLKCCSIHMNHII